MFLRRKLALMILTAILLGTVFPLVPVFSASSENECEELFFDNFNEVSDVVKYGPDEYTSMTLENGKLKMIAANSGNGYTSRVCFGLPGDCSLLSSNKFASDKFVIEFEVSGAPIRYGNAMHVGINGKVIGENGMYTDALAPNQLGTHYVVYDRVNHTAFWYTPKGDIISNNSIYEDSLGENSGFWFYIQGTNTSSSGYELDYVAVYTLPEELDFEIRKSELDSITISTNSPISFMDAEMKLNGRSETVDLYKVPNSYNLYRAEISPSLEFGTVYTLESVLKRVWDESVSVYEKTFRTRDKRIFVDIETPDFAELVDNVDIRFEIKDETGISPEAVAVFTVRGNGRSLKYISAQDIVLSTGTVPMQVSLPAMDSEDIFEVVIFDSLEKMNQIGKKISVSHDEIKNEEYIPKNTQPAVTMEINVDNEKLKAEFEVTLDENAEDSRVSVIVLKEGASVISAENIYWFDLVYTQEKKATAQIQMPDKTAVYNVYYSSEGGELKNAVFDIYDSNFVPDALASYNGEDIKGSAQKYEKGLNLSHNEIAESLEENFFKAVLEIRKENYNNIFSKLEDLKKAYETAKFITLKSDDFISEYNAGYGFDSVVYSVYNDILSENAKRKVSEELKTSETYNLTSVSEKFNELVVLKGIEYSEHYSQTTQIITNLSGIIGLDMSIYNTLRAPFNVCAYLAGKYYENFKMLNSVFNALVTEEKRKEDLIITGSSGGGGGGGGKTGPSRIEVTPEVLSQEKEEKPYFTDTENVKWAQEAIENLYKKGIVSGKAEGKFFPDDLFTREETAKIIVKAYSLEADNGNIDFTDVSASDWSYPYVKISAALGIMKGISDKEFGSKIPVTREMLATVIYRINKCPEIKETEEFADMDTVSEFAYDAVLYLKSIGIVKGAETGNFEPGRFCTRAEAAKMIYESLKYDE